MTEGILGMKIERELWKYVVQTAEENGVTVELDNKKKHLRWVFRKGEVSRFVTSSRTPSDYRWKPNFLRTVKNIISQLGDA
jgi:hypothetical protein